jgi:hypothetical protein
VLVLVLVLVLAMVLLLQLDDITRTESRKKSSEYICQPVVAG